MPYCVKDAVLLILDTLNISDFCAGGTALGRYEEFWGPIHRRS